MLPSHLRLFDCDDKNNLKESHFLEYQNEYFKIIKVASFPKKAVCPNLNKESFCLTTSPNNPMFGIPDTRPRKQRPARKKLVVEASEQLQHLDLIDSNESVK